MRLRTAVDLQADLGIYDGTCFEIDPPFVAVHKFRF